MCFTAWEHPLYDYVSSSGSILDILSNGCIVLLIFLRLCPLRRARHHAAYKRARFGRYHVRNVEPLGFEGSIRIILNEIVEGYQRCL